MATTTLLTEPPKTLVRDPICGMEFNPAGAAAWRILDGQTYYFCSERCAKHFDGQNPGTFAVVPAAHVDGSPDESFHDAASAANRAGAPATPALPGWLVPACVAALMAALLAVTVFGVSPGTLLIFAMVLACPLMHLFMMRSMGHGDHSDHSDHGGQKREANREAAGAAGTQNGRGATGAGQSCH